MILREIMVTINKYCTIQYIHTCEYPVENPKPSQKPSFEGLNQLIFIYLFA